MRDTRRRVRCANDGCRRVVIVPEWLEETDGDRFCDPCVDPHDRTRSADVKAIRMRGVHGS